MRTSGIPFNWDLTHRTPFDVAIIVNHQEDFIIFSRVVRRHILHYQLLAIVLTRQAWMPTAGTFRAKLFFTLWAVDSTSGLVQVGHTGANVTNRVATRFR